MTFNSNNERRAYWKLMGERYSREQIEEAFRDLKPDTERVIRLHYEKGNSLKEIGQIINRSLTVVRNHHNRGIYKLYRHFNPRSTEIS